MDQAQSAVKTGLPESYLRFYLWEIGVLKLLENHVLTSTGSPGPWPEPRDFSYIVLGPRYLIAAGIRYHKLNTLYHKYPIGRGYLGIWVSAGAPKSEPNIPTTRNTQILGKARHVGDRRCAIWRDWQNSLRRCRQPRRHSPRRRRGSGASCSQIRGGQRRRRRRRRRRRLLQQQRWLQRSRRRPATRARVSQGRSQKGSGAAARSTSSTGIPVAPLASTTVATWSTSQATSRWCM